MLQWIHLNLWRELLRSVRCLVQIIFKFSIVDHNQSQIRPHSHSQITPTSNPVFVTTSIPSSNTTISPCLNLNPNNLNSNPNTSVPNPPPWFQSHHLINHNPFNLETNLSHNPFVFQTTLSPTQIPRQGGQFLLLVVINQMPSLLVVCLLHHYVNSLNHSVHGLRLIHMFRSPNKKRRLITR